VTCIFGFFYRYREGNGVEEHRGRIVLRDLGLGEIHFGMGRLELLDGLIRRYERD